jgi:hypothetical protein
VYGYGEKSRPLVSIDRKRRSIHVTGQGLGWLIHLAPQAANAEQFYLTSLMLGWRGSLSAAADAYYIASRRLESAVPI